MVKFLEDPVLDQALTYLENWVWSNRALIQFSKGSIKWIGLKFRLDDLDELKLDLKSSELKKDQIQDKDNPFGSY